MKRPIQATFLAAALVLGAGCSTEQSKAPTETVAPDQGGAFRSTLKYYEQNATNATKYNFGLYESARVENIATAAVINQDPTHVGSFTLRILALDSAKPPLNTTQIATVYQRLWSLPVQTTTVRIEQPSGTREIAVTSGPTQPADRIMAFAGVGDGGATVGAPNGEAPTLSIINAAGIKPDQAVYVEACQATTGVSVQEVAERDEAQEAVCNERGRLYEAIAKKEPYDMYINESNHRFTLGEVIVSTSLPSVEEYAAYVALWPIIQG